MLTKPKVKTAKDKEYKLLDHGDLYALVRATSKKLWNDKDRFANKEKTTLLPMREG